MYLAMILFSLYKKYQSAVKRKTKHKGVRGTLEERTWLCTHLSNLHSECLVFFLYIVHMSAVIYHRGARSRSQR